MKFLKTFLILLLACPANSQVDSILAEQKIQQAKICLKAQKIDSATIYHRQALELFQRNNMLTNWLKSHAVLGNTWAFDLQQPYLGIELMEKAVYNCFRQPVSEKEWEQYCLMYLSQGHIFKESIGDFIGAKQCYEKGFDLFVHKLGEHNHKIAKYIYHQLGNIYTRLGDFERAKNLLQRGVDYGRRYDNPKIADHGDLALALYEMKEFDSALRVIRQGIDLEGKEIKNEISILLTEAVILKYLGRANEAFPSCEKAKKLIDNLAQKDPDLANYFKTSYYEAQADIFNELKLYPQAIKSYRNAIASGTEKWGTNKRREIGKFHIGAGEIYLVLGKPKMALQEFHEALRSTVNGFESVNLLEHPNPQRFISENTILEALHGKARAFHALNQLEKALECYELIPIVEAKLRATHAYESSSLLALKESRQRFHEAVDIAWKLFEQSNGNPQYAERAFRLTELARGMLLLQSLVQARQFLPNDIRDKDYNLRVKMAWLEHEIADLKVDEKGNERLIKGYEDQLFDLKLGRQKILTEFPSYNSPDSLFLEVLAAKDVHKLLRPGQALIDFFLTEKAAYVFSFDANGEVRWRKTMLPEQFREQSKQLAAYLWAGEESGHENFLKTAWILDSLLLVPEQIRWGTAVNSIMVVPDDVLMLVPFEVLLSRPALKGSVWRDQPWLLVNYNMAYAYSATLLSFQNGISEEHASAPSKPAHIFGGFAPSYSESSAYKLQNTRPMVKNICNLLGGKAWLGAESDEARFKNSALNYRTLLLAMHGISDSEHPELSHFRFGDPGPDSLINNNILYASELQIMRLQADLVVLSACHSGSGKLEQGEGVYSLARAFAAAGVPATVMSLWLLHENTAPPLVEAFFKYLQQGKSKDEALRMAKLDFLKSDENFEMTHPFFWAGLTAVGDMRALDLPAKPVFEMSWWWVLVALAMVATGFWGWNRRNRRL